MAPSSSIKSVSVCLPEELYDHFTALCEGQYTQRSTVIRQLIAQAVREEQAKTIKIIELGCKAGTITAVDCCHCGKSIPIPPGETIESNTCDNCIQQKGL